MKFQKSLYSKIALLKAAYNYTDRAFVHLDADDEYYYVSVNPKQGELPDLEREFSNEMLTQSLRHEVYLQTKNLRELMFARAMATSLVTDDAVVEDLKKSPEVFSEDEILKDWFAEDGDVAVKQ